MTASTRSDATAAARARRSLTVSVDSSAHRAPEWLNPSDFLTSSPLVPGCGGGGYPPPLPGAGTYCACPAAVLGGVGCRSGGAVAFPAGHQPVMHDHAAGRMSLSNATLSSLRSRRFGAHRRRWPLALPEVLSSSGGGGDDADSSGHPNWPHETQHGHKRHDFDSPGSDMGQARVPGPVSVYSLYEPHNIVVSPAATSVTNGRLSGASTQAGAYVPAPAQT